MGVIETFPLMKWDRIFDLTEFSRFIPVFSPLALEDGPALAGATSTSILLLGTRVYENTFSFPHSLLNCCRVASSSFSNTSKKFAVPECGFPSLGFFQHLSSECPKPKQKEHFIPQFSILWDIPHLAHFSRGSFNLGHTVAIWSPPLQIWHPPNMVGEDDVTGFGTFPFKKLMSVLFKAVTCFSIIVSATPSSCSSFSGSNGVFPSSPSTLSSSVAALTSSSISANVLTTHNFRIFGLNLAKNLLFCSASCIFPFWNSLSRRPKYFWTLSLGFGLMASSFILMSSASTFPYFCMIRVFNLVQSAGASYNLLNHSLALPLRFNFAILKSLSAFRSRTSAAMVNLSAQSLTSSWSLPQNNSSIT